MPAVRSWLVFCVPSARPLQNGPAISAIAVNANPLSDTVITDATITIATLIGEPSQSVNARRAIAAAADSAMTRIGFSREPATSDHRPAAIRPAAPSTCASVTSRPAEPADQPRSTINQTSVNVHTTTCGATRSTDTAWIRHSVDEPRYGLESSCSAASARAGRGGSFTASAHTTAEIAHTTAGNSSAAETPWFSASRGITNAPNPTPNG